MPNSWEYAQAFQEAEKAGLFFSPDAREIGRDLVIKTFAAIVADRRRIREILEESLHCCSVSVSGKLEVLDKEQLAGLHAQADELRARAAHNESVLDKFDQIYSEALEHNPSLEPTLFSLKTWKKVLEDRITRGKNSIRTTAATWLASPEGARYDMDTIKNHPRVQKVVQEFAPQIEAAERELPLAAAILARAQAVLGEAILPGLPEPAAAAKKEESEYNRAITRGEAI